MTTTTKSSQAGRLSAAFGSGGLIGALGGLIGLGGAEFRLPLLIGAFRLAALEAVILNKAMSLVVWWRQRCPFVARVASGTLYRVIAILLVVIAAVLLIGHDTQGPAQLLIEGPAQIALGVGAGLAIGAVAAILSVAGGELLIPTLVLLFGADIKTAGSISLAVSLPTMLIAFARYSRDRSFAVLASNRAFVLVMALGSLAGSFIGGQLLGIVPAGLLLPLLTVILVLSAIKVWQHR